MNEKFLKPYNPQETEDKIYKLWEKSGFFNPDICLEKGLADKNKKPFSIALPPPNVTGILHIGHATMLAIQDIMVRYNRMTGRPTLWIPGTDHASIATEEKFLKTHKDISKRDYADKRDEFIKLVNDFALNNQKTIISQMRSMGASLDWSRLRYTLDEKMTDAVYEAFIQMYNDDLIYMGQGKVINWDPKGQTVVSDDEIEYTEDKAGFYTFKYSKDFPISISTTRPETKVGDTAVAVNPDDERYRQYIGQNFEIDFVGVKISVKIIGDPAVDPEFGTGALGVTPAHSIIDAEIASRHNLPSIQIINEYAKMNENAGKLLEGKKTTEAREIVVNWLKENNLLEKEEIISQNIPKAQRSGGTIEPLPKRHQFFIKVNEPIKKRGGKTLKELMREVITDKEIQILPERFEKVYLNWIENLRDWSISRQIWYGHRIPAWYKESPDKDLKISKASPGDDYKQFTDTLDTWFSSGLWTFSTLGWPEKTKDLEMYHPTSAMETGYDIIFFWVARMILMSTYLLGEIPFEKVYLHGLVRDEKGRKMSKSLGNTIDPLTTIEKYGADATRLSLIIGTSPGNDLKLSEMKIKGYKNYANKIWNITRFIISNTENINIKEKPEITEDDQKIISEFNDMLKDITSDIENFRFYLAGEKIYQYVWHNLADKIIEDSKEILQNESDSPEKISRAWTLNQILENSLKILHPFMPFVTEEIWQLTGHDNLLMIENWPEKTD